MVENSTVIIEQAKPKATPLPLDSAVEYGLRLPIYEASYQHTTLTLSQPTNLRLFQTERVCRRQFEIC